MFKFAKGFLDKGIQKEGRLMTPPPPLASDNRYIDPMDIVSEPELVIGKEVTVIGKIIFQREIHVNGVFEGELEGKGKIVVGPEGFVKADINIEEAEIAGKVEGNITVKGRLTLHGEAEVRGNITAPRLSVDEGVSIMGQVHVTASSAPEEESF